MIEERLVEIETKIAFQEQTIMDLNDVVYEQHKEIQRLSSICDALMKNIKKFSEITPEGNAPEHERPPHY